MMNSNIFNTNQISNNVVNTNNVNVSNVQSFSGLLQGSKIQLKSNPISIIDQIQDFSEEIAFVNKQGEKKQTLRSRLENKNIHNKKAIDIVNNYLLHQVKNIDANIVDAIKIQILSKPDCTANYIVNILNKYFPDDISNQFLMLMYLEQSLQNNDQLYKTIKKIRKDLEDDHESEIYAGLNITKEVLHFAKGDKSKISQVRKFYRKNILEFESLSSTYQNILNEYGCDNFFDSVDFILSALGADLNAQKSSLSDIQLKPIMDDIYQLQEIKTIYDLSDSMVKFLHKYYNLAIDFNANSIMNIFLPMIVNENVSIGLLDDFCKSLKIDQNIEAKIVFANFLNNAIHNLPEKVFKDNQSKINIVSTIENYNILLYEEEMEG